MQRRVGVLATDLGADMQPPAALVPRLGVVAVVQVELVANAAAIGGDPDAGAELVGDPLDALRLAALAVLAALAAALAVLVLAAALAALPAARPRGGGRGRAEGGVLPAETGQLVVARPPPLAFLVFFPGGGGCPTVPARARRTRAGAARGGARSACSA